VANYYFSNPAIGQGMSNLADMIAGDPLDDIRAGLLGAQRRGAELEAERLGFGNQAIQAQAEMLRQGTTTPGDFYADSYLAGDDWLRYAPETLLGFTSATGADDDVLTDLQTGAGISYGNTIAGTREGFDNAITRANIAAGPGYARVAEDARQFDEGLVNIRVPNEDGSESIIAVPRDLVAGYEGQAGVADELDPNALLEAGEGPLGYVTRDESGGPYIVDEEGNPLDRLPIDNFTESDIGDIFRGETDADDFSPLDLSDSAYDRLGNYVVDALGEAGSAYAEDNDFMRQAIDLAIRIIDNEMASNYAAAAGLAAPLQQAAAENGGLPIALSPDERPESGYYIAPDGTIRQAGGR